MWIMPQHVTLSVRHQAQLTVQLLICLHAQTGGHVLGGRVTCHMYLGRLYGV
jgi:hypothetical protein